MSADRLALLIDHLRVGSLLDQRVREVTLKVSLGEAEGWILVAMSGLMGRFPSPLNEARSCLSIASELGYSRERVSMRLKPLCAKGLVSDAPKLDSRDGRRKEYQITAKGRRIAERLFSELCQLERDVRYNAELKRDARAVDAQRVACALWVLGDGLTDFPVWLDRV